MFFSVYLIVSFFNLISRIIKIIAPFEFCTVSLYCDYYGNGAFACYPGAHWKELCFPHAGGGGKTPMFICTPICYVLMNFFMVWFLYITEKNPWRVSGISLLYQRTVPSGTCIYFTAPGSSTVRGQIWINWCQATIQNQNPEYKKGRTVRCRADATNWAD